MATTTAIMINRAPVLTLWASLVAEQLGFDRDEALSLGRAVAGLNAQSKGRRLGVFKPHEEKPKQVRDRREGTQLLVEVCSRTVPVIITSDGVRATTKSKPIDPAGVERYLGGKFGEDVAAVRAVMKKLARSLSPAELASQAYSLYEEFRPEIPTGKAGWGARGTLDLELIGRLARSRSRSRRR